MTKLLLLLVVIACPVFVAVGVYAVLSANVGSLWALLVAAILGMIMGWAWREFKMLHALDLAKKKTK